MGLVFISYRREDTAGEARALFSGLVQALGRHSVFMDVDNVELGYDFRETLNSRLASCDIILVMIGKNWANIRSASGMIRLDDPKDFVRQEIGAALRRSIPVTPILVQGARMPAEDQLPEDLRSLAYRHGFELSHARWESDVRELLRRLQSDKADDVPDDAKSILVPGEPANTKSPRILVRKTSSISSELWRWIWIAVGFIIVAAAGTAFFLYWLQRESVNAISPAEKALSDAQIRLIQHALCMPPDGTFGPNTRAAIQLYRSGGPLAGSGAGLDEDEVTDLVAAGPCNPDEYRNAYERFHSERANPISRAEKALVDAQVRLIQHALCLPPDGTFGPNTRAAIDLYRFGGPSAGTGAGLSEAEAAALVAAGPCDPDEYLNAFERFHISREQVRSLQELLHEHLRDTTLSIPTGILDASTRDAIRQFQRTVGMANTGAVTPELVDRLAF